MSTKRERGEAATLSSTTGASASAGDAASSNTTTEETPPVAAVSATALVAPTATNTGATITAATVTLPHSLRSRPPCPPIATAYGNGATPAPRVTR